ncbi:hypothetical protein EGH21_01805 [Halomicroarcula sp. F13]|uniref:Uncharacterized protein n=1 Tax=Haloarcula rubra TaxID=2487747 RepID=A0AAW4PN41_9EURY|nr:hypothetical protein [Halomicroarcula rubra]MBX0321757.1 hypothetical protein [Halomicroarcula rubra]
MTSLTDVYEGEVGRVASRRQQLVGSGLFLAGVAGLVAAIALATTDVGVTVGTGEYAGRRAAGILAGVGLPAVVLGVFAVLPASRRVRATAVLGASVSLLGVAVFQHIYPYDWMTNAPLQALGTSIVYVAGVLTTFWCLFAALATFNTRKSPGGSARMEITEEGTIELVEEARSIPGMGGIGFFGDDPDGGVETQTNRRDEGRGTVSDGGDGSEVLRSPAGSGGESETASPAGPQHGGRQSATGQSADDTGQRSARTGPSERDLDPSVASAGPESSPSTDGGTTSHTGQDPITETAVHRGEPDNYCGNCRHFQYVMDGDDVEPYCTFHEEMLDDMDPCPAWVDND